ncbi:hypothetical protein [Albidovulum sp.]
MATLTGCADLAMPSRITRGGSGCSPDTRMLARHEVMIVDERF